MQEAYTDSYEHLSDELKWLDLVIKTNILRQQKLYDTTRNNLKGLVIEDGEINNLLNFSLERNEDEEIADLLQEVKKLKTIIDSRKKISLNKGIYLSLPHLSSLFHLNNFEEKCILICLAPELNKKYEKLFAYIQDDITIKKPTVNLILNLLFSSDKERLLHLSSFFHSAPLSKFRLIQLYDTSSDNPGSLLSKSTKLDERITSFLLGLNIIDIRLGRSVKYLTSKNNYHKDHFQDCLIQKTINFVDGYFSKQNPTNKNLVFYFHGKKGSGRKTTVRRICNSLRIPVLYSDIERLITEPISFGELSWILGRECILQQGALCIDNIEALTENNEKASMIFYLIDSLKTFSKLTFILSKKPCNNASFIDNFSFIDIEFPEFDDLERKNIWETYLNGTRRNINSNYIEEIASKFHFTEGRIKIALETARNLALWQHGNNQIEPEDIYNACRLYSDSELNYLARKLDYTYSWNDIILPPDKKNVLRNICNYVKFRHKVLGEWGLGKKFSMGNGLNVLFSGSSGTGKTMAAQIIAKELNIDIFRIDLSRIVSKYIGETEKNLDKIFTAAGNSNVILFFDEADALFGKRSEVKDAHDRYANIEIAYLLQKIEEYNGIVILATNLRSNIDDAFVRRMHYIVDFPYPDETMRKDIWLSIFPENTPLNSDIDFNFLARQFKLSGGNIRNVATNAAFLAASENKEINIFHLINAVKMEYEKIGKLCLKNDFGEYYEMLEMGCQ